MNEALSRGEYFWTDIVRDGVILYELPGHPLVAPQPLTPQDAYGQAKAYYESKLKDVDA